MCAAEVNRQHPPLSLNQMDRKDKNGNQPLICQRYQVYTNLLGEVVLRTRCIAMIYRTHATLHLEIDQPPLEEQIPHELATAQPTALKREAPIYAKNLTENEKQRFVRIHQEEDKTQFEQYPFVTKTKLASVIFREQDLQPVEKFGYECTMIAKKYMLMSFPASTESNSKKFKTLN